jgi:16S rRNA A1518/A1519 N6-dimethyltransferase RsmA/KsgA/DIM1 with predicted DNA glycosylase/AP lyase activity
LAFLIVQREAAATWTGEGRSSIRAVRAWLRFAFDVPLALRRRDFDPWPRVESVVLAVRLRPQPLLAGREARAFEEFAVRGFMGGATVARNLRGATSPRRLAATLDALDIESGAGPASLSPAQWLALWEMLGC